MPTPRRTTPRAGRPTRPVRRTAPSRTRPSRRSTSRTRTDAARRRRPRYTNRMAVLVVVFAVLAVSYASSMRAYLRQQSEMNQLKARIASSKQQIRQLRTEKHRWHERAYVEQQARARFGWVMPGETAYQVIGKDGRPLTGEDQLGAPVHAEDPVPQPWWDRAYGSLQRADQPEKYVHPKPQPAKRIMPQGKHSGSRQ